MSSTGCPVTKLAYYFGGLIMLNLLVRSMSSASKGSASKTIERFGVAKSGRFSESIRVNGMVYTSGQVGKGATIQEAARMALADLDHALALAGVNKTRVVSVNVYLKDIKAHYSGMNEVYDAWVQEGGQGPPCRATVQAALADTDWLVEFSAIAAEE